MSSLVDHQKDISKASRASKWTILKSAISPKSSVPTTSINSFPGFGLVHFNPISSHEKTNLLSTFNLPLPKVSTPGISREEEDWDWTVRLIRRAVIIKSINEDKRSFIKVTVENNQAGINYATNLGIIMKSIPSPTSPTTLLYVLLNLPTHTLPTPPFPFTSPDLLSPSTIKTATFPDGTKLLFRIVTPTVTRESLTSNLTQGVDNTGQTRIWECAVLTLRHVINRWGREGVGELAELGGGMVGFTGLWSGGFVTDGHDSGVFNNGVNMVLNGMGEERSRKLIWDDREGGNGVEESMGKFDTVVVSDCVHFRDFHSHLVHCIGRLLKVGGRAIMVQPKRGGSLDAFKRIVVGDDCAVGDDAVGDGAASCFAWVDETAETGDRDVWDGHTKQDHQGYREDAHLPIYVTITKEREWREGEDGLEVKRRAELEKRRREEEREKRRQANSRDAAT